MAGAFLLCSALFLCAIAARTGTVANEQPQQQRRQVTVTFVNELPNAQIDLYWENHETRGRKFEGTIDPRGGFLRVDTYDGHEFSYEIESDGERHYFQPKGFAVLLGSTHCIQVRCDVTTYSRKSSDTFNILVKPYWSQRGASRFLELVRSGYYDGVALNRVVPGFLTQFGIAADPTVRNHWGKLAIVDDLPFDDITFQPGYLSFAGSGIDSRTTEIFIVMPGVGQEQLDYFGENSWETPFGLLEGNVEESALTKIYSGYGDMPPWGKGPESSRIYDEDGYTTYLPNAFPLLDYIERCYVVDEVDIDIEEEL